jgi:hypothetical protein
MNCFKLKYAAFFLYSFLAFSLVSLHGCETLGYENVDTTRKAILVSTSEVRQANALLQDLITRNVIDNESALNALGKLQDAHKLLQDGLNAIDVLGDPVTAEDNLSRANISISLALSLLAQFT